MLQTQAKRKSLLGLLKSPPQDFDGSNKVLARYMGVSTRTVIRLMKGLVEDGKVRVSTQTLKTPSGYFRNRLIQLVKEIS